YAWNDPVFARFNVTPASAPPDAPPGGCSIPDADGAAIPLGGAACNAWRSAHAAWDADYQAALDRLGSRIDAYNAEVDEDNRQEKFDDFIRYRYSATTTRTELVASAP